MSEGRSVIAIKWAMLLVDENYFVDSGQPRPYIALKGEEKYLVLHWERSCSDTDWFSVLCKCLQSRSLVPPLDAYLFSSYSLVLVIYRIFGFANTHFLHFANCPGPISFTPNVMFCGELNTIPFPR